MNNIPDHITLPDSVISLIAQARAAGGSARLIGLEEPGGDVHLQLWFKTSLKGFGPVPPANGPAARSPQKRVPEVARSPRRKVDAQTSEPADEDTASDRLHTQLVGLFVDSVFHQYGHLRDGDVSIDQELINHLDGMLFDQGVLQLMVQHDLITLGDGAAAKIPGNIERLRNLKTAIERKATLSPTQIDATSIPVSAELANDLRGASGLATFNTEDPDHGDEDQTAATAD